MSFLSKSSAIQDQELAIQEVTVRFSDLGLYTQAVAGTVVVDLGEPCAIISCIFMDDSVPSCKMVSAANQSVTAGGVASLVLGATFATGDVLRIQFKVSE